MTAASATAAAAPTAEAHNHVNVTVNYNHPPYAQMIYAAITALKERNGSSRRAIAKYIKRVYSDFPPTHSALLSHHLKRLKNTGLLVMVKKSYKLPRTDSSSSSSSGPLLQAELQTQTQSQSQPRGRPPKPNPNAQPVLVVDEPPPQPVVVKRGRGRPRKKSMVIPPPLPVVVGPAGDGVISGKRRRQPKVSQPHKPKKIRSSDEERRSTSIKGANPSSPDDNHQIKRQKSLIVEDQISTLPVAILLRILSFLPTKDIIKTSVLSKRWSNIWNFRPSLSFKDNQLEPDDDFACAVDDSLKLHRAPRISEFFLEFIYNSTFQPHVDRWVHFATSAKVQKLSLNLLKDLDHERYMLPQHLYDNELFTALELCLCNVVPGLDVNWSSLKRLSIGCTVLTKDAIRKVLLGSPKLEFLELYELYVFRGGDQFEPVQQLDIGSESLRKLVIREEASEGLCFNEELDATLVFEIVAPNIQALEILGHFDGKKCRLKNVASLVEAKLDFDMCLGNGDDCDEDAIFMVSRLFDDLHHVKELTVGFWCLSVLSIRRPKKLRSFSLPKCKCLTVKTGMEEWGLLGLIRLLESLPYLETLVIDMLPPFKLRLKSSPKRFFNSFNYNGENHWKSKEMFLKCLQFHLKTVKIFGFGHWVYNSDLFILLTKFLLKNSRELEKMIIRNSRWKLVPPCDMAQQLKREQGFSNLSRKLLSFPRSSPHAVVLLEYE